MVLEESGFQLKPIDRGSLDFVPERKHRAVSTREISSILIANPFYKS
jgi:hypothetical protein